MHNGVYSVTSFSAAIKFIPKKKLTKTRQQASASDSYGK